MASTDTKDSEQPKSQGERKRAIKQQEKDSMAGSMKAIGELRKTSRMRSQARTDVRELEQAIEGDRAELAHRVEVAKNYDAIIAEQTKLAEQAAEDEAKASGEAARQGKRLDELKDELSAMKESHEQKLRPYRNLMESSRGRADDAAKQLATAKRDVRRAESDLNDATKRRTQRITSAHRSVDNAKERLATIQNEMDHMQTNPEAKPAAAEKLQEEYAAQQRQLERANAEVTQVTQESQNEVDQAQQYLWRKQRELTKCEQDAEAAKQESMSHKDEYDRLFRQAQERERKKQGEIRDVEHFIETLESDVEDAQRRAADAEEILEDARDIQAHPELTEMLRERIADEQQDLKDAKRDLAKLTSSEKELRKKTLSARIAMIAAAIAVVLIVAVIIWMLIPKQ